MSDNIKPEVLNDIQKIKQALGDSVVEKICLFGSCIINFNRANDIDIAIFSKNLSVAQAKKKILSLKTNYPIKAKYINGSYSSIYNENSTGEKHYHIIILSDSEAKRRFIDINKGLIKEI